MLVRHRLAGVAVGPGETAGRQDAAMPHGAEGEGVVPIIVRRTTDGSLATGAVLITVTAIDRHFADVAAVHWVSLWQRWPGWSLLPPLPFLAALLLAALGRGVFALEQEAGADRSRSGASEQATQGGAAGHGGRDGTGDGVEGGGVHDRLSVWCGRLPGRSWTETISSGGARGQPRRNRGRVKSGTGSTGGCRRGCDPLRRRKPPCRTPRRRSWPHARPTRERGMSGTTGRTGPRSTATSWPGPRARSVPRRPCVIGKGAA